MQLPKTPKFQGFLTTMAMYVKAQQRLRKPKVCALHNHEFTASVASLFLMAAALAELALFPSSKVAMYPLVRTKRCQFASDKPTLRFDEHAIVTSLSC